MAFDQSSYAVDMCFKHIFKIYNYVSINISIITIMII